MSQGASNANNTVVTSAIPTAETVGAVTIAESVASPLTTQGLRIRGTLNFTGGASTTGVTVKCRQGSGTGGAQVGTTLTQTLAASASAQIPFDFLDVAPLSGNNVYAVTLTATGAAGTLNAVVVGLEICDQYQAGSDD